MKITIEGSPKEIADFVFAVQNRLEVEKKEHDVDLLLKGVVTHP